MKVIVGEEGGREVWGGDGREGGDLGYLFSSKVIGWSFFIVELDASLVRMEIKLNIFF